MSTIEEKVKELIKNSTCFGVGFDMDAIECRGCDVKLGCEKHLLARKKQYGEAVPIDIEGTIKGVKESKVEQAIKAGKEATIEVEAEVLPTTPNTSTTSKTNKTSKKESKTSTSKTNKTSKKESKTSTPNSNLPNFPELSMEQLEELVKKLGGNVAEFDKYANAPIKRMRMVVWIKKHYKE